MRLSDQVVQQLLGDYQSGQTGRAVAMKYGLARSTVIKLARKHGLEVRHPRVTAEQQAQMVELYRSGMRQVDIAEEFKRNPGVVWHVLRRAGVV